MRISTTKRNSTTAAEPAGPIRLVTLCFATRLTVRHRVPGRPNQNGPHNRKPGAGRAQKNSWRGVSRSWRVAIRWMRSIGVRSESVDPRGSTPRESLARIRKMLKSVPQSSQFRPAEGTSDGNLGRRLSVFSNEQNVRQHRCDCQRDRTSNGQQAVKHSAAGVHELLDDRDTGKD